MADEPEVGVSIVSPEFVEMANKLAARYADIPPVDGGDPLPDLLRLIAAHPSALGVAPDLSSLGKPGKGGEGMIEYFARIANLCAPGWTINEWKVVIGVILRKKHGGSYVRIKKLPRESKILSAKGLTVKQIQQDLGVSRTYAYKLFRAQKK